MGFRSDIQRWANISDFRAHLNKHDNSIASWARGIVLHHTVRPDVSEWRGMRSMYALRAYYTNLGWPAGPHLFIAADTINPANNGIYQLTAINEKGVHASGANSQYWGIEVVGNFDLTAWSLSQKELVYNTIVELLTWRNITKISQATLLGHREVPSLKTCPGSLINMDIVRADIALKMRSTV
jgi:hypothetical protein